MIIGIAAAYVFTSSQQLKVSPAIKLRLVPILLESLNRALAKYSSDHKH
jgi:hypothetical protein